MAERPMSPDQGFGVDLHRLASSAGDFDDLATRAAAIAAELGRALETTVAPLGDDEVGRAFAGTHAEPAARTRERIDGLAGELEAMGRRFARAADAYRDADGSAAADVTVAGSGD
jgi:hypothetical protein